MSQNDENLEVKLWDEFDNIRKTITDVKDPRFVNAKNRLIEFYYDIVFDVAKQMHPKYNVLEVDELASYGVDGLYGAIDKFERERGLKFKTYASVKIRGAILDNLRKVDWVPRLVRQRDNEFDKISQKLETKLGRKASDSELAKELGIPIEDFLKYRNNSNPVYCSSIFAGTNSDSEENHGDAYNLSGEDKNPLSNMLRTEMCHKLLGKSFTKLERKIMYLHYYEDMTLKEISNQVNLSESRISQMHADILKRLKKKMERNPEYSSELAFILGS